MIRQIQIDDWQKLVDYLKPFGNGACINSLLEDGPDDHTDFAGLLRQFRERDVNCNHELPELSSPDHPSVRVRDVSDGEEG